MKSVVCDILGIRYPIIQGGMVWVSGSSLAAAVSMAGGLGVLAGGSMTPPELKSAIGRVRRVTNAPFGVNLPIIYPLTEKNVDVVLAERVPVVITSAGNPALYTSRLKAAGVKVLHVVPSVRLAMKAEAKGVDMVVAEGWEAGGHNGLDEIPTMTLIPQVVDAVDVPVIAAGGIADARGVVAAFALGAKGVQMGTGFLASKESEAVPGFKERVAAAGDAETTVTLRSFSPVRSLKNRFTEWVLGMEYSGISREEILEKIGEGRARMAAREGDLEMGSLQCGAIAGLVREIRPAGEIVEEIVKGIEGVFNELEKELRDPILKGAEG